MNLAILGINSLGQPAAIRGGLAAGPARLEYRRMKAAREPLDDCKVVELWGSERGYIERYIADQKYAKAPQAEPEATTSETTKSQPKKSKKT